MATLVDSGGLINNYSDANDDGPGIAITGVTPKGTLYCSTNNGTTWEEVGPVSPTSARVLYADANTFLYFQPNEGYVGSIDEAFRFKAWDRNGGYANGLGGVSTEAESLNFIESGICETSGWQRGVVVDSNYAYLADAFSGLAIIEISNPTQPIVAGVYHTRGYAQKVAVSGSYAFVAEWDSGLEIIDISNPTLPVLVGTYDMFRDDVNGITNEAVDVIVNGNYVYLAECNNGNGLEIIDISNPASPVLSGIYEGDGAISIAVIDSYAYLINSQTSNLEIVDVSNPTKPVLVSTCFAGWSADSLTVNGNYAYVAAGRAGLVIVDISNPLQPILVGSWVSGSVESVGSVAVNGNYAYVGTSDMGMLVLNISNPTNPCSSKPLRGRKPSLLTIFPHLSSTISLLR